MSYSRKMSARLAAAVVLALALLFVLPVAGASAFKTHLLLSEFGAPGRERTPTGVAINETTGHFFVAGRNAVFNYGEEGVLDGATPELVLRGGAEPFDVEVDNSGGAAEGDIYVSSPAPGAEFVEQFSPTGAPTGVMINLSSLPPNGTPQSGGLPPVVRPIEHFRPRALAIRNGDIYISDDESESIIEFGPSGEFIAQYGAEGIQSFSGLAVAESGDFFGAGSIRQPGHPEPTQGVFALNANGECAAAGCAPLVPGAFGGIAISRSAETLLVTERHGGSSGRLDEYAFSGALAGSSGEEQLADPFGVAIDESTGEVIVSDALHLAGTIKRFGPTITLPSASTEPPTGISDHSALFHGLIGADEGSPATCVFQYVSLETFAASGFSESSSVPCEPGGPFTGSGLETVSAEATGFSGGTEYRYRVLGRNELGVHGGGDVVFTTSGPEASDVHVAEVTETTASVVGAVNPRGLATTYVFEYVSEEQYEASGFAGATRVPAEEAQAGSGESAVAASQIASGLVPGAKYRMRLVAKNADGTGEGVAPPFTTYPANPLGLPDDRAYEQASPVNKNGSDALGEVNAVQAALSGGAATFFSNSGIPGGTGAQQFPSYLSVRSQDGSSWQTQGLLPPGQSGPVGKVLGWNEELSEVYVSSKQPTTPAVLSVRSVGTGALTEITAGGEGQYPYLYVGTSGDEGEAFFESGAGELAPGADPIARNVYVWDGATRAFKLASALNDGSSPTGGAFAGPYNWFYANQAFPPGGVFAGYYVQQTHAVAETGEGLIFTSGSAGNIYLREYPAAAQSPLGPGEHCAVAALACTIEVSAPEQGVSDPGTPAAFVAASADDQVIYFLDAGKLTSNGQEAGGLNLYRFEVSSGHLTDLTPTPASVTNEKGADVQGVLGASKDGSHLYFVANGALEGGVTPGNCEIGNAKGVCNLYELSGSAISYIGKLSGATDLRDWLPTDLEPSGHATAKAARVSDDGATLLFSSSLRLTGYDNRGTAEVYRFAGGAVDCLSCDPSGARPSGPASLQANPGPNFTGVALESPVIARNMSLDGSRVVFDSPDKLVSADHNGVNDVYEWELPGTGTCTSESPTFETESGGCLFLISTGQSPQPSYFADADQTGNNVFFFTGERLVGQDKDSLDDLYDAKVDGGIPAQSPAQSEPCNAEECALPPAAATPSGAPGSSSFNGPGNPPTKKAHKKHKKKQHKRRHHRQAKKSTKSKAKKSNKSKAKVKRHGGGAK